MSAEKLNDVPPTFEATVERLLNHIPDANVRQGVETIINMLFEEIRAYREVIDDLQTTSLELSDGLRADAQDIKKVAEIVIQTNARLTKANAIIEQLDKEFVQPTLKKE